MTPVYDPVKTRLPESETETEESANRKVRNRIGLFFRFCLRLLQYNFHRIVSKGVISGIRTLLLTPSV